LVLVWINKTWTTKTKWIITAIIVVFMIGIGAVAAASSGSTDNNASTVTTKKPTTTETSKPANKGSTTEAPTTTKVAQTCNSTPADKSLDTKKQGLYPGRMGVQKNDHEAAVGDCVRVAGMTAWLNGATTGTNTLRDQVVEINVRVQNRDKSQKTYSLLDWSLQTAGGQILNASFFGGDLSTGDLVSGGEVTGTVQFEAPPGEYYVIYNPTFSLSQDRGIWKVTV